MDQVTCIVDGCDKPRKRWSTTGWCTAHYSRVQRTGDLGSPQVATKGQPKPACSIADCERPAESRGWCSRHYWHWRKKGDPLAIRPDRAGANNNFWQGDSIGYTGAHERVRALHGSPKGHACVTCGGQAAHWAYDHLDPAEKRETVRGQSVPFSTDPSHYQAMCVPCHKTFDLGHIAALRG